jgi:hypothetical protein
MDPGRDDCDVDSMTILMSGACIEVCSPEQGQQIIDPNPEVYWLPSIYKSILMNFYSNMQFLVYNLGRLNADIFFHH